MKEMNRREFLTLTGAAVVALSLAGCGGGPSVPPAPAAPTQKELDLLRPSTRSSWTIGMFRDTLKRSER